MVGRTVQETAQLSTLWTLAAATPLFFLVSISTSPNGALARVFSFIPLTSPVAMLLGLAGTRVSAFDILGSMIVDVAGVAVACAAASKLFRTAALMYGQRAALPEVIRWLRAA